LPHIIKFGDFEYILAIRGSKLATIRVVKNIKLTWHKSGRGSFSYNYLVEHKIHPTKNILY